MVLEDFDTEIRFAVNVVRMASELAQRVQKSVVGEITKEDCSPVTVADFAVQALVGRCLMGSYPQDPLVAEEDADLLSTAGAAPVLERVVSQLRAFLPEVTRESALQWIQQGRGCVCQRFWILDPIDGTKGFLRGDQYVVALALVEDGRVRIGVLGCPVLGPDGKPSVDGQGSVFVAGRKQGCWSGRLNGSGGFRPVSVSSVRTPESARVLRSVESGHTDPRAFEELVVHFGTSAPPVFMDSQAKCATLAAGHAELLFRLLSPQRPGYKEKIWDQAAGSLVIEEAGGKVTDLQGRQLDFQAGPRLVNNSGIVASNGHLHDLALRIVRRLGLAER